MTVTDPAPGGVAPTFSLAPSAYLDPAVLALELERVFERSWSIVADAAQLAEVGATLPVRVGRCPIVVVRTEQGLRAHHNICRHRGMQVISDPSNCNSLRCGYHGWEWSLDGDLARVPQRRTQFPDLDDRLMGLMPAAVDEWEGMVLVNADPAAAPLAETLSIIPEGIGSFRPGQLDQVAQITLHAGCNWKLFVENHVDVYHLWYLHDRTLADFDHTQFEHTAGGGNWSSYEPVKAARRSTYGSVPGAVAVEHIDDRDRFGIGAHMVFPNLLMASTADYFITYAITPVTPTSSTIDLRVRAESDSDADALVAAARSFIDEDIEACERIQMAMRAERFVVGPLAQHHERPIEAFQQHLLDRLAAD